MICMLQGSSPQPKRSSHDAVEDQDYDDEGGEKDFVGDDTEDYDRSVSSRFQNLN